MRVDRELRDQRLTVECPSRENSGHWTIIESRAPGGGPTSTGISEDQIWTSETSGQRSDLNGIRATRGTEFSLSAGNFPKFPY